MQGEHLTNHNMKVSNRNIVTASVVSEATEVVGVGSSSLAGRSSINQRRAKWWSHNSTTAKPDNLDKLYERASLSHCPPLRLRGGNGDNSDDIEIDNDQVVGQTTITPTNGRKRKAGDSPPGPVPDNIALENAAIDVHIRECKIFLKDMHAATKCGTKWIQGIEDFLAKIQTSSTNISLEAAVISGKYQEAKSEVAEANRRLEKCINAINGKQPKRLYVSAVKGDGQTPLSDEDDYMVVEIPPTDQKRPVKDRLGDFPAIEERTSKKGNIRKRKGPTITRNQGISVKLKTAKNRPVKPAFIVNNHEDKIKLDDIWKVVSSKISNPKLDGCRKLPSGDYVLTTSDDDTAEAIRNINDLTIKESAPRKPRVKLKSIPIDYTTEFIAKSLIGQNQALAECSLNDIRPLFRCGKRNEHTSDWVVEVSPTIYKSIIGKKTFVGMVSTFPRQYTVAPHCRRCLKIDHRTADCKAETNTCFHCAKPGHSKSDCPVKDERPRCAHCDGAHTTLSKNCAKWVARTMALQSITSYECA